MTKASISSPGSTLTPPPPRYGGFRGALTYGLLTLGLVIGIGVVGSVVMGVLTGSVELAWYLLVRTALLGTVLGGAATVCRSIRGGGTDRLWSLGFGKGEWGSVGVLAGLIVAGSVTERQRSAGPGEAGPLAIGQPVEIAGPTLDGGQFDLADCRGKVVLVDFWATWCPPCLAELPNLRAAYQKYHAQGLEVVGVSFDHERSALEQFQKDNPLPWPQIFFEGPEARGFDNPLGRRYGIGSIPCLLLIDREGKLLARNMRGRGIEMAVLEALGQPVTWDERLVDLGGRLVRWLFVGALVASWWLLLVCGLGGALVVAGVELLVRGLVRLSTRTAGV